MAETEPRPWLALLHQNEIWIPADGVTVKIVDMSPGHVRALIIWLDRQAAMLHMAECFRACTWIAGGDMANDALDLERALLWEQNPVEWLHDTDLWKALLAREEYFYGSAH